MSGLRLCFRLAWRAARRERLATFLTALLVALPVVALVAAGLLARSSTVPQSVAAARMFGAADVTISVNSDMTTNVGGQQPAAPPGPLPAPPLAALPAGSRLISGIERGNDILVTNRGNAEGVVDLSELDYADPLAKGMLVPRSGTAPTGPGEVAVTTHLAHRLHLRLGENITLRTVGRERVVGIVDASTIRSEGLIGAPGAFSAVPAIFITYYVALPVGTDAASLKLPASFSVNPRFSGAGDSLRLPSRSTINSGALVLVLALLEASLTAGTAFAVGARRRRRDLALIAVNGGRPAHTAGVVLANGLVCGVIGVAVGLVAGIGAARIGYPYLQSQSSDLLIGLKIDPLILVAAAAFGLVSSLVSAGFPALLAARGSLRSALGKSRGSSGTPGWITVTGIGVFGLGIAVVSAAVHGVNSGDGSQTTTALLGVVFVELGGVAVCPALLGLAGRFGSHLPALPRLALRDSARQRTRSGPAVAAIAAAVSGAMALSVYLASDHLQQVRDYQPPVPRNLVSVSLDSAGNGQPPRSDIAAVIGVEAVEHSATSYELSGPDGQYVYAVDGTRPADNALVGGDFGGNVTVAGTDLLRLLGASPATQQALIAGDAVVTSDQPLPRKLALASSAGRTAPSVSAAVPIAVSGWRPDKGDPGILISATTATKLLASLSPSLPPARSTQPTTNNYQLWAPVSAGLSDSARDALREKASNTDVVLNIDSGVGDTDALETLALLGVAALFSLIVTAAATVLAAAESRADLSVLGAVGATSFARRLFTAAQGSTTALLGGVLGIAIGLVPGIAVVQASADRLPLSVPWQPFLAFLVGLPLLAGIGGVLFSRSRLPGVTRIL